jgi:hypothetical protein
MEISNKPCVWLDPDASNITSFKTRLDLLDNAVRRRPQNGLIMEFGVWQGESINFIASKVPDHQVHGFDCFTGLPEYWRPGFDKGCFATDIPYVRPNVELHSGLFDQTLPAFLFSKQEDISFMHLDCDLYSSTRTVFDLCKEKIVAGTTIVFDEFFNYPEWKSHEYKAFSEFIFASGKRFDYFSIVPNGEQVGV